MASRLVIAGCHVGTLDTQGHAAAHLAAAAGHEAVLAKILAAGYEVGGGWAAGWMDMRDVLGAGWLAGWCGPLGIAGLCRSWMQGLDAGAWLPEVWA